MIKLTVKTRDGASHMIESAPNLTLMEGIRKAGIYELVALCGGSCSCATCHVFVEEGPDEIRHPASADEDELLESADHRTAASRLACQIKLSDALAGLVVQIAPES
jgi:2Fe-2S ferredoxin